LKQKALIKGRSKIQEINSIHLQEKVQFPQNTLNQKWYLHHSWWCIQSSVTKLPKKHLNLGGSECTSSTNLFNNNKSNAIYSN